MSDDNARTPDPAASGQPDPAPQPGEADAQQNAPPASDTQAEVEALKAEIADLKDRLLRSHAEMDNIRKRTEREKSDAHKYAVSKFAHDIVTVGDNFQRAISAVPASAIDETPALKSFLDGVVLTERELLNALERHGIKRIDPKGEPFNPHLHQAVMEDASADAPAGTVTQVFQPGYSIEDRILRPAMVVVAKGRSANQHPAAGDGFDDATRPDSGEPA